MVARQIKEVSTEFIKMKIIGDVGKAEAEIKTSIARYGYLPQHHFELFLNYGREKENCVFLDAGEKKGIFGYRADKDWRILTDPVCPTKESLNILTEAIDLVFKKYQPRKIILEDITENLSGKIRTASRNKPWRILPPSYSLSWTLIDLKNWTDELPGKKWKRFRKIRNKFFRENQTAVKNINEVDGKELKDLLASWKEQRKDHDRVHLLPYTRFIDNALKGLDLVRIMEINGRISSISGGWRIPNSENYYSFFGIHDYCLRDIGEVAYLDEFSEAKKMGIEKIDLGGSEKELVQFKNKFHPESFYKTDTFSVMPR